MRLAFLTVRRENTQTGDEKQSGRADVDGSIFRVLMIELHGHEDGTVPATFQVIYLVRPASATPLNRPSPSVQNENVLLILPLWYSSWTEIDRLETERKHSQGVA